MRVFHDLINNLHNKYKMHHSFLAVAILILLGIFFRIWRYAINRSLWLDEALLALNITDRSFGELREPLSYNQGSPIGFLFIEKLIIEIIGNKDFILRLFPFIAGIFTIFLMYIVAKRYLVRLGFITPLALIAISPQLIHYSSDVKQYSTDVLVTLLLLYIGYIGLESKKNYKYFIILAISGIFAMWFSHPALFILGGIVLSLTLNFLFDHDTYKLKCLISIIFLWLLNFYALYYISLRSLASNTYLINYWKSGFIPLPPWKDAIWFFEIFTEFLKHPVELPIVPLTTILLFLGCLSIILRKWQLAIILILPFPSILIASGVEKYPFKGRMVLFLLPIVFLLVGEGIERIRTFLNGRHPIIGYLTWAILFFSLLLHPFKTTFQYFNHPPIVEDIKPMMLYLSTHRLITDQIYVYYAAAPAFKYYAESYGFRDADYIVGIISRENPDEYLRDIDRFFGEDRMWFVFTHNCSWCNVNEKDFIKEFLDRSGSVLYEYNSIDASLYLYDLHHQQ